MMLLGLMSLMTIGFWGVEVMFRMFGGTFSR